MAKGKRGSENGPKGGGASRVSRIPGYRLVIYWIFALAVLPVLMLGALEGGLRLFGYGYPTQYFLQKTLDGQRYAVANPAYLLRFFPPTVARPVYPVSFRVAKPPETIRCFVLGESAAMGEPDPDFSFWRILQAQLAAAVPGKRFEFINCATSAINSHALVPIARECARYQPDLFIVFAGNNEVIGPLGPSSAFGGSVADRRLVRAGLLFRATRTGQLVDEALRSVSFEEPASFYGSTNPFIGRELRESDPRLGSVCATFQRNVDDALRAASESGAAVVLCTLPSNLRDYAPLASRHRPDLSAEQLRQWQQHFDAGKALEDAGRCPEATQEYLAAAERDDTFAELAYHLGQCALAQGDKEGAYTRFVQARDCDGIRMRADSRMNAMLRSLAASHVADNVVLADVEEGMRALTLDGIPGSESFYDHVHMTHTGNYRVATAVYPAIARALPNLGVPADGPLPLMEEQCAQRLAITDWHRARDTMAMVRTLSAPPFVTQLNHAEHLAGLRAEVSGLLRDRKQVALVDDLRAVERFVAAEPDRLRQWANAQQMYFELGDYAQSLEVARKAKDLNPLEMSLLTQYGTALANAGQTEEALVQYRALLRATPKQLTYVRTSVGAMLARELWMLRRMDAAENQFKQLLALDPKNASILESLGSLSGSRGDHAGAFEYYTRAIENSWEAPTVCAAFDNALVSQGNPQVRVATWRWFVERFPDRASLRRQLAITLEAQSDWKGAIGQWREAVKIDPTDAGTMTDLANALRHSGDASLAERTYRDVLAMDSAFTPARDALAAMLDEAGNLDAALETYREAIRNSPASPRAYEEFDSFLEKRGPVDLRIRELRNVLRDHPDVAAAHFVMAHALDSANLLDSAIAEYQQAHALDSGDPDKKVDWGWALQRKGQRNEARRLYDEALARDPYHAAGLNNRGYLAFEQGNLDEALKDFRAAATKAPRFLVAFENIDNVYERRKDKQGRVREWRDMVAAMPLEPILNYRLALALKDNGDVDAAIQVLEVAVRYGSDFLPAKEELDRLRADKPGATVSEKR